MKRVLAAIVVLTALSVPASPAIAGPLDPVFDLYREKTAPVWDLYDRKFGCGSSDPILCPGP